MSWFRFLRKQSKYKHEQRLIDEEISRSRRFGFQLAVLAVELSHRVPLGLSRLLPGKTVSFHILRKDLRLYDKVIDLAARRYHIILPQTERAGAEAVKERIFRLSQAYGWGNILIGIAVFPEDGETSNTLLTKAIGVLPVKEKNSDKGNIFLTEDDRVRP